MEKTAFILAILSGVIFSNVCCTITSQPTVTEHIQETKRTSTSPYGAYLAGRMAHIRHDLNTSADYYILAAKDAPKQQMLPSQLYIMLTSQGRVDEAIQYADKALQNNDESPFIYTVKVVHDAKRGDFDNALKNIENCNNDFSKQIFTPLVAAWVYAGKKDYDNAIKSLDKLPKHVGFRAMYLFHAGAISDFLGHNTEADKYYSLLMSIRDMELSVFPTQVLSNFYLRTNNPEKVKKVLQLAANSNNLIIKNIASDIEKADSSVAPVLYDAMVGMSDSLFGIALILQQESSAEEIALLFASLSDYANPDNDLPKILMGSILESKELYKEANSIYERITPKKNSYYSSRYQIGKNNLKQENYDESEKIYRSLLKNYPETPDIYTDLGEVMRMTQRYRDAIIYYEKALAMYPENMEEKTWSITFVLSTCYDQLGQSDKAEQALRKVLKTNPIPHVQNQLGYTLLKNGHNIEEAFELLVNAANKAPEEGTIVDSLGWALYQIGKYEEAITLLERASDLAPSEALIYDHLGDAYWEVGRKGEAVFQWNHAIGLQDHSRELDKTVVMDKIENGKKAHTPIKYNKEIIGGILEKIHKDNSKED